MTWGPVFAFELITTARRGRYYAARVAYGLVLLYTFLTEYQRMFLGGRRYVSIKDMSQFAESAFIALAWGQGLVLLALVPAMVAGVVADEHQRKTLHYLLASRLTSAEIVLGKLGARLLQAGVFVAMGVPVVCIVGTYGGLDPWDVFYVYAGTFSLALFVSGLSMLVSVAARRPREAILAAYGLEAVWLLLVPIVAGLAPYFTGAVAYWLVPMSNWAMATHPVMVWGLLSTRNQYAMMNAGFVSSGYSAYLTNEVRLAFVWMIGLQTAFGCLFLALAVVLLRPLRGGAGGRRRSGLLVRRRERAAAARPACGADPMLWKERYTRTRGGLDWLTSLPVVLLLGTLLGCYLFDAAWPAVRALFSRGSGEGARLTLNAELRWTGALWCGLWLVAVASGAAVGVTAEREEDTWTSLTATLLTGPEILRAKMLGAVWGARRLGVALLATWGVGLLAGAVHPLGLLAALTGLGVYTWFATALGLWMSLKARNSTRALVGTILVLIVVNLGPLFVLTPLVGALSSDLALTGVMPYVEWSALFSYRDVRALWAGQAILVGGPPSRPGPQTFGIVCASVLLYALGALALTRAAPGAFAVAVDRPRRASDRLDDRCVGFDN